MISKTPQGQDISSLVLTDRQLNAGLKILEDEHWLFMTTSNGTRIATFGIGSDREFIQDEANNYLKRIDWQE